MNVRRRNSIFSITCSDVDTEEEKLLTDALETPYEKVMKILMNIKVHLELEKADQSMITDLDWVMTSIQSNKLYTYDNQEYREELIKISKKTEEVKSFFEYLNNFSENREVKRRAKQHISKTTLVKPRWNIKKPSIFNQEERDCDKRCSYITPKTCGDNFKLDSSQGPDSLSLFNKVEIFETEQTKESPLGTNSIEDFTKNINLLNINFQESPIEEPNKTPINNSLIFPNISQELEKIFEMNFNIFDFEEAVGRSKVLVKGTKTIFESFDLNRIVRLEFLENFLNKVRDGYSQDNQYHNDLHGFDVCQAAAIYLTHTNLVELLFLNDHDILAFILSAVVHDLGHPGLTNNYQINSCSDLALIYNDKSVLESYHVSEAFKIMRNPECNILQGMDQYEYRRVRKRMIEAILSTDMINHAKVQSLVKNRLVVNNIKQGSNQEKIVNKNSNTFFEDQQEILNFLIHTADISHNSRSFEISQKWTGLLMEEFWRQGDLETKMNLPVSFLCDRVTADAPKSQIGFITGIIIPTFDVLVDFLPTLVYYKDNVYDNIEQWRKIVNKQESEKENSN
jgi:hypothetical protein